MIVAGALLLTVILMNIDFNLIESGLYDFRISRGPHPKASDEIVLITLDDQTARALDEFLPLPLDQHSKFLERLETYNPKAIGYLVDMNRVNQANPEEFKSAWGNRFVRSANRLQARGIPLLLGTRFDVTGEVLPPYPLSSLSHSIAVIHKDGNVFAEDKVTRRALLNLYEKPVFHLELAQLASGHSGQVRGAYTGHTSSIRGSFNEPQIDADYFFFRYHGDTTAFTSKSSYKRYSFIDIMNGAVPAEALNGKILLVGTMTREDSGDFAITPYSKAAFSSPKLVVHANILDSIINDNGVIRVPKIVNWISTFLTSSFVIWSVFTYTPVYGVVNTVSLALGFLILGQFLFSFKGIWIRESQPLIGIFLGYYVAVPYRLIREYKKRWDYQRKNELLVQVEELKTNFLSLVTHDLKTPVARIQGLAEVLLRKASERLIDRDKETLHHIISSTDELNRFISSILELTKVESNNIHLTLESKDVNQLIEKAVEGFKAQARAGQLRITTKLEPLFPIKVDPTLMSKILNNLIDNALKYSPKNSEVFIESKESGDWVEISITDQGIGMTEAERSSLFTRFYRAKNDTTTQITGTGLGLYLTKYFIEAHSGRVEVESEQGKGSTFRIFLPVNNVSAVTGLTKGSNPQEKSKKKEVAHV